MFSFILAVLIFAFIGNGFLSFFLKSKKNLQLSVLENLILSFGLGINFVIIFFYAIDIFGITNFFFVVPLPIIIGFIVKLLSIPTKFRWNHETWEEIKTYFKLKWHNVKTFFTQKGNRESDLTGKDRRTSYVIWALIIGSSFLVLYKELVVLGENFSQLALDPNSWANNIANFISDPSVDYSVLSAYPAGFIIFSGFILYLFPSVGFYDQFFFLKMLPLANFALCLLILYPIQKRLFKNNKIFYVIVILLVSQKFFVYRTIMLLPTILVTTQLEILLLMLVIEDFPRPMIYFSLSSMLFIHTANAAYVLILFFGYLLFNKLLPLLRRGKEKTEIPAGKKEGKLIDTNDKIGFHNVFKNLIAFLLPISIWVVNLTIRYSPAWYTSFLFYFGYGSTIFNSIFNIVLVVLATIIDFFYEIGLKAGWIALWGGIFWLGAIFYGVLIYGVFHKFKRESTNKPKNDFIKLAKFSVFAALFIWFLPLVAYLLEPMKDVPFIEWIYNILNSTAFIYYTYRIFEVVAPIFALFGAVVLEELYHSRSTKRLQNHTQNNGSLKKKRHIRISKKTFLCLTIGCLFVVNFCDSPYYEYYFDAEYSEGIVYFRQYLDANGTPGEIIGYCENSQIYALLSYYIVCRYSVDPINSTINATIARNQYLENITCPLTYLVISRNDDNNWEDLLVTFQGTNNLIVVNSKLMILKK